MEYYLDELFGVVHLAGCRYLDDDVKRIEKPNKKFLFRKELQFCSCMKEELSRAQRERNQDIINRSEYNYLYSDSSNVFHRRSCKLILTTTDVIRGSVYFKGCAQTGRRPCRVCHPDVGPRINFSSKKPKPSKAPDDSRNLTTAEQRGLERYHKAKAERFSRNPDTIESDVEKDDFYTLTCTRNAFFAAAGYSLFHVRECQKLNGLSHIKGFRTYRDAVRAGHQPCRYCKPTKKDDLLCSVPITSRARKDEDILDIKAKLQRYGFPYKVHDNLFLIRTPVGRWRFDKTIKPYVVEHINLVKTPGNTEDYHRQGRLFLSMDDIVQYIRRHDLELIRSQEKIRTAKEARVKA